MAASVKDKKTASSSSKGAANVAERVERTRREKETPGNARYDEAALHDLRAAVMSAKKNVGRVYSDWLASPTPVKKDSPRILIIERANAYMTALDDLEDAIQMARGKERPTPSRKRAMSLPEVKERERQRNKS